MVYYYIQFKFIIYNVATTIDFNSSNIIRDSLEEKNLIDELDKLNQRIEEIKNHQGKSKKELKFVNRDSEIDFIMRQYSVWPLIFPFISAPAQYGVSWFLKELERRFQQEKGAYCLYLSFKEDHISTAEQVIAVMLKRLGCDPIDESTFKKEKRYAEEISSKIQSGKYFLLILDHVHKFEELNRNVNDLFNKYLPPIRDKISQDKDKYKMGVIFGGRYIHTWKEIQSLRGLPTPVFLKPLNLKAIKDAIADYNNKTTDNIDDNIVAKILHMTGGHPGCMAYYILNAPEDYALKDFIRDLIGEIESGCKDQNAVKCLRNLCVFRKYDLPLLKKIMEIPMFWKINIGDHIENIVQYEDNGWFRDALVDTHLVEDNGNGFIEDDIVRRLFFIQLRETGGIKFLKLCETAKDIYYRYFTNLIEKSFLENIHLVFIELLYQELQYAYYKECFPSLEFRPNLYSDFFNENGILENLLRIFLHHSNIHGNLQALKDILKENCIDWEFEFAVNFFLRTDEHYIDKPYKELYRRINKL